MRMEEFLPVDEETNRISKKHYKMTVSSLGTVVDLGNKNFLVQGLKCVVTGAGNRKAVTHKFFPGQYVHVGQTNKDLFLLLVRRAIRIPLITLITLITPMTLKLSKSCACAGIPLEPERPEERPTRRDCVSVPCRFGQGNRAGEIRGGVGGTHYGTVDHTHEPPTPPF